MSKAVVQARQLVASWEAGEITGYQVSQDLFALRERARIERKLGDAIVLDDILQTLKLGRRITSHSLRRWIHDD